MTVSALTSATTAASSTAAPTGSNQLQASTDDFLKMFMAQLQAQDPLDPQKGSDMVAQLAQLSSVEQASQTNSELAALVAGQGSSANASMSTLVGRTCDATAGDFSLQPGGTPPPLDVSATSSMSGASVVITDASGKEVRRMAIPSGTSATIQWDGKDASGNALPQGSYHVAIDQGKSTAAITAEWHGAITAVELTADGTRLQMGDLLLNPADITTIGGSAANVLTGTAGTTPQPMTTASAIATALAATAPTSQVSNVSKGASL